MKGHKMLAFIENGFTVSDILLCIGIPLAFTIGFLRGAAWCRRRWERTSDRDRGSSAVR